MQGVIRGIGEQKVGAVGNFFAYYTVGLPLGYYMCFRWGFGVAGLWWGLIAGLLLLLVVYAICILRADWRPKVDLSVGGLLAWSKGELMIEEGPPLYK